MKAQDKYNADAPHGVSRTPYAFTLIEMVVVIAVILVLALLFGSAVSRSHQRAVRAVCANNIHQQLLVYTQFGLDHRGQVHAGRINRWLWDIDYAHRDNLIHDYGLARTIMYDPGVPEQNNEWFWRFRAFDDGQWYTVSGYWLVMVRKIRDDYVYPAPIINAAYRAGARGTRSGYVSVIEDLDRPSDTVMIADATISSEALSFNPAVYSVHRFAHRAPHLDGNGDRPAGFYVGHVDGSVVWGQYDERSAKADHLMVTDRDYWAWW